MLTQLSASLHIVFIYLFLRNKGTGQNTIFVVLIITSQVMVNDFKY